MILAPPESVRKLQTALQAKAKGAPNYRFYALSDKLYRPDILGHAFDRCRANGGAPGVDGQTCADIEEYGVDQWLGELAEELRCSCRDGNIHHVLRRYELKRRHESSEQLIHDNPKRNDPQWSRQQLKKTRLLGEIIPQYQQRQTCD